MLIFHPDDSRHEDCLVIIVSVSEHETLTEFGFFVVCFGLETCHCVSGVK